MELIYCSLIDVNKYNTNVLLNMKYLMTCGIFCIRKRPKVLVIAFLCVWIKFDFWEKMIPLDFIFIPCVFFSRKCIISLNCWFEICICWNVLIHADFILFVEMFNPITSYCQKKDSRENQILATTKKDEENDILMMVVRINRE